MTPTPSLDSRIRINDDVLWQELQGEAVLLNLKTGVYFGLNPIGSRIWALLADHGVIRDVIDAIVGEYDVEAPVCADDVIALVADMQKHALVTVT
jgi:hypothetical protein